MPSPYEAPSVSPPAMSPTAAAASPVPPPPPYAHEGAGVDLLNQPWSKVTVDGVVQVRAHLQNGQSLVLVGKTAADSDWMAQTKCDGVTTSLYNCHVANLAGTSWRGTIYVEALVVADSVLDDLVNLLDGVLGRLIHRLTADELIDHSVEVPLELVKVVPPA